MYPPTQRDKILLFLQLTGIGCGKRSTLKIPLPESRLRSSRGAAGTTLARPEQLLRRFSQTLDAGGAVHAGAEGIDALQHLAELSLAARQTAAKRGPVGIERSAELFRHRLALLRRRLADSVTAHQRKPAQHLAAAELLARPGTTGLLVKLDPFVG